MIEAMKRIRICLFLMNRWGKKNLSTLNSITKMNIRVYALCFALEMANILFYFHLTSHEMVYRHDLTRIETFKVRVVILFSHTGPICISNCHYISDNLIGSGGMFCRLRRLYTTYKRHLFIVSLGKIENMS